MLPENGIDVSKEIGSINTLKSWFSGGERPKKGEKSRRKMFALAFALNLDADKTAYLLQKVFLDRAFNKRNYRELIYYYCIEKQYSLSHADQMIARIHITNGDISDRTVSTELISRIADKIESDDELIEYINSHPHNFSANNVAAKKKCEEYIAKAKECVKIEVESIESHQEPGKDRLSYHKKIDSTNFMYSVIIEQPVTTKTGTRTVFRNEDLFSDDHCPVPKEIRQSFPEAVTFSKKNPSYDELRKMLILFFLYHFWYKIQYDPRTKDLTPSPYDDYVEELDNVLYEAGLPLLYPGNPFDWMFCFCTLQEYPLDVFRGMLSGILRQ